jgi:VanZ family protein
LWRYGPLVLWLGFIFLASTGMMAASNTSRIIRPLLLWLDPNISEAAIAWVHFAVRKAAHFTEYAVLALLAARAFAGASRNWLREHWMVAALVLVALYALTDEFHQTFVPSRTGSIYDSMIDTAGGFTALMLYWLWRKWRRPDRMYRRF